MGKLHTLWICLCSSQKCQFAQFIVGWSYHYSYPQLFSNICCREHHSIWTLVWIKSDVSYFYVFGCLVYVHITRELHWKLKTKTSKVAFVGYLPGIKGWKFFYQISKQMLVSRDAVFLDDQFMETEVWHEDQHGQTSCVGYDCVTVVVFR